MKISCVFHLKERYVLPPSSPLSGVFSININVFSAQLSPPGVISHVISSQVWNLYTSPKLLFSWLTKSTFREQGFHPFKDTYSTKGHGLGSVDSQTPAAPPPLSGRMHCVVKMMNDLQRRDRVLFLTARRWELYRVYISLQRGNKTRWFSPAPQVTSHIKQLLRAGALLRIPRHCL